MKKKEIVLYLLLAVMVILINLLAWKSKSFCDWHVKWLFPAAVNIYGRFMSIFPFSVGEWMIIVGVLLAVAAVPMLLIGIVWRKSRIRKIACGYFRFIAWTVLIVCMIMTYNCFILYHASEFDEKYMADRAAKRYSDTELAAVRDHIVENLNELTVQMLRDEKGYLIYEDSLTRNAISAMQELGKEYEQLSGYYPEAKEIRASDFLSQEYMMGYYFPFSMEANYNRLMYVINKPATICHELSHLKGFIYEDDANFIGFLACIRSEDPFFRYSGYMSVLGYVENEFLRSINRSAEEYYKHPVILQSVYEDDIFLTDEAWEEVEKDAVLETETVKDAANQFTEATLKVNGVEDGMRSYGRVVQLLLEYYDGILY